MLSTFMLTLWFLSGARLKLARQANSDDLTVDRCTNILPLHPVIAYFTIVVIRDFASALAPQSKTWLLGTFWLR